MSDSTSTIDAEVQIVAPDSEQADASLDVLVRGAVDLINKGSVTMADLLKALSPEQTSANLPAVIPSVKEITESQRASMEQVPEVYGRVVPTERRLLQPVEVTALVTEKNTLDRVKKMAEARLADITLTVHNHLDVLIEEHGEQGDYIRDDHGHYIAAGKAGAPDVDQEFSREVRNYAPTLNVEALKALEETGGLSHEDYLSMTTQVRVVDENKVLLALKRDPSLIQAIAKATKPGLRGTSMFLRKRK